jgi:CRISPR-associated protein Cas6/Cse3/CasE subtype I-E
MKAFIVEGVTLGEDSYTKHQQIADLIDSKNTRFHEREDGSIVLLSETMPEGSKYTAVGMSYSKGEILSFSIRACVSKRSGDKEIPITNMTEIVNWITRKARENGFVINFFDNIEGPCVRDVTKPGFVFKISTVDFAGNLTVLDKDLFDRALRTGIGRKKAFGCGVLCVTRSTDV